MQHPNKWYCYYRCKQRYGHGARDCTNTRSYPAAVLEEVVWQAVYSIVSDTERLKRQWQEHIDRQIRRLR